MGIRQEQPLWGTWRNIMTRCYNKNSRDYKNYGGRGIKVSDRWLVFENFVEDMGIRPNGLSIERKNNDLGYCKENCYWADSVTQGNNKRNSCNITYQGITKTLSQWIKYFGLKKSTIEMRYYCYKWSIEKCFNNLNAEDFIGKNC